MANVLKKIQIGNPLIYLEMWELYDEHEAIETDEELINFYHKLLNLLEAYYMCNDPRPLFKEFIYSMIAFSTGVNINPLTLILNGHED